MSIIRENWVSLALLALKLIAVTAIVLPMLAGCAPSVSGAGWESSVTSNNPAPHECREKYTRPPSLMKGKAYTRSESALAYNRLYRHDVQEGRRADRCREWALGQER